MSNSWNEFNYIARNKGKKKLPPFSLRLTFEERARLEELAGDQPLGSYIKRKIFDGKGLGKKRARSRLRKAVLRAKRLRKGARGLWDRLTGKRAALDKQNQLEALWALQRDREQRQAVIEAQLSERRVRQQKDRSPRGPDLER